MNQWLLNQAMVKAFMAGNKTQTRTPIKHQREFPDNWHDWSKEAKDAAIRSIAPSQVGDTLYVRETMEARREGQSGYFDTFYTADDADYETKESRLHEEQTDWFQNYKNWHDNGDSKVIIPSIHMPKWAARNFARVTAVRAERVQDISEADALDEGIETVWDGRAKWYKNYLGNCDFCSYDGAIKSFQSMWNSLYPGSWERNDFVWVRTVEKITKEQVNAKTSTAKKD